MNKIKRAIIMAAGMGTRLNPVTLQTPKPLVKVNGERIIDTIIKALHKNNIKEIYIVVGYLKEKFEELELEYEGIKLIYNDQYDRCNNISSLFLVKDYLEEAIILDGDQIINNSDILHTEFDKSGYHAVWTEDPTKEWLLTVENDVVVDCSRDGGVYGWQLYGISRWTKEDGQKLKYHIELEFVKKKNAKIYWDDVAMFCYPKEYQLTIYPMNKEDVVEIDSINDLAKFDNSYSLFLTDRREENESKKN